MPDVFFQNNRRTTKPRHFDRSFASRRALCQSAHMEQAYVRTGELRDGRSLLLDEAVPLATGKVRVTVQQIAKPGGPRSHAEVLAEIHAQLKAAGHVPPTAEEVVQRIQAERNSWD